MDTAAYLVRNPLSLKKLVYLDGQQAVLYRSKMNPFLGRNFEALDPLEWLARMSDHIPDSGQHRTHFYGEYANRVRGERQPREAEMSPVPTEPPRKRCAPSWALHPLRPAHEHCRLRHRRLRHPQGPRAPQAQHTRSGEATAPARGRACRRARPWLGRAGGVGVIQESSTAPA